MNYFQKNYPLKNLNTFCIDVTAKEFTEFSNEEELKSLLLYLQKKQSKLLILGGGSNVLFEKNFDGIVLKNKIKGISETQLDEDNVIISIGAGEIWDEVVKYAVNKNYFGIENLSLIPGSAGAAPIQNIGAYGTELKDVFDSLEGIFIDSLEKKVLNISDCKFEYRESIFKNELKNKFVITKVNLILSKKKIINISYSSLEKYFSERKISNPSLQQIRNAVIEIRKSKLPDPEKLGNAGSFFKNPKLTKNELANLKKDYPDIVYYPFDEKYFKIAAGWLIEKCGLKGKRIGNVGTHKNQALVIVNYGKAVGSDIVEFSNIIRQKVFEEFGILLEQEVSIIH